MARDKLWSLTPMDDFYDVHQHFPIKDWATFIWSSDILQNFRHMKIIVYISLDYFLYVHG